MQKWMLIAAVAALPFASGAASAAEPLSNSQMDQVTAGFTSLADANSQALGKIVATLSATLSQVNVVTNANGAPLQATFGETTLTLIKSIAASQSASTATNALPTAPIGLSEPGMTSGGGTS